jgi:hypothetical protein
LLRYLDFAEECLLLAEEGSVSREEERGGVDGLVVVELFVAAESRAHNNRIIHLRSTD